MKNFAPEKFVLGVFFGILEFNGVDTTLVNNLIGVMETVCESVID